MGIIGAKEKGGDAAYGRNWIWQVFKIKVGKGDLVPWIKFLLIRVNDCWRWHSGKYRQVQVDHEQFVFARYRDVEVVLASVNSGEKDAEIHLDLKSFSGKRLLDMLNPGTSFPIENGSSTVKLASNFGRIYKLE